MDGGRVMCTNEGRAMIRFLERRAVQGYNTQDRGPGVEGRAMIQSLEQRVVHYTIPRTRGPGGGLCNDTVSRTEGCALIRFPGLRAVQYTISGTEGRAMIRSLGMRARDGGQYNDTIPRTEVPAWKALK
ncbi:hypothetical protein NDU88_006624 [Pleurodeles waltl]|uniref:Uncharacterized protein n=1 Tax=Pleurodeles waltl TaxID=8319 RepID=A0AAV7TXL6_PLEWA|nr:hypothetical protein NDU88_006624 [Pleurodeles waltl]